MDERFNSSLKFHHMTSAERSGFASTGALLTPCSSQIPVPLSRYHGVTSPLITSYAGKTECLVCSAIEAHEHYIQLLKVLTKIFPLGEGDLRVSQLLLVLTCTAYPTRDSLYKQLGILRRELALRAANKTYPTRDALYKQLDIARSK